MKTVCKFKEGEHIPRDAKYLFSNEQYGHSQVERDGGVIIEQFSYYWHYYEVPVASLAGIKEPLRPVS